MSERLSWYSKILASAIKAPLETARSSRLSASVTPPLLLGGVVVLGVGLMVLSLFGWRHIVSARSISQITESPIDASAPQPRIVVFNLNHDTVELPTGHVKFIDDVNEGLYQGLLSSKRCDLITRDERATLLNPAWTTAPSTPEEALELGRETGADWAIQSSMTRGSSFYQLKFKLLALKPLRPYEDPKEEREPTEVIDYNTLDASKLLVAEHLVWITKPEQAFKQLRKVGRIMLSKARFNLSERRKRILEERERLKEERENEPQKPKSKPKLSARERRAKELSDAAQRELDAIQARIEADYVRRKEEAKIKREVLSQEASEAWAELERLSGGAGVSTVKVVEPTKLKLSPHIMKLLKARRAQETQRPRVVPAQVTWERLQAATRHEPEKYTEYKQKLLNFVRTYQGLEGHEPQIAEAQNRYTWLNRREVEWVKIYGHSFPIGALAAAQDSLPITWVEVGTLFISRSEVTNAQYKRCVDAGVCTPPHWDDNRCEIQGDRRSSFGSLPAIMRRGDMPVVCIDWDQANRYATWVGGRLLSESEWEFAARSGEKSFTYPWGRESATCDLAVIDAGYGQGCGFKSALPVCSRVAGNSKAGLCDLAGNVWEWVADTYNPSLDTLPRDAKPLQGRGNKVVRGGSFVGDYREVYASARGRLEVKGLMNVIGFRVARDLEELATTGAGAR